MKRKNSLLIILFFSASLLSSLVALEISNELKTRLKTDNGYLRQDRKSNLLAYIMIHYVDIKREVNSDDKLNSQHVNDVVFLMSIYKNNSLEQSYHFIEKNLEKSNSPIDFYNKIK